MLSPASQSVGFASGGCIEVVEAEDDEIVEVAAIEVELSKLGAG